MNQKNISLIFFFTGVIISTIFALIFFVSVKKRVVGEQRQNIDSSSIQFIHSEDYKTVTLQSGRQKIGEIRMPHQIFVSIFRETDTKIYFGVTPEGLGGYINYGGPFRLYAYDKRTGIFELLPDCGHFVTDIYKSDDDEYTICMAYLLHKQPNDKQEQRWLAIGIRSVTSPFSWTLYSGPQGYSQAGDAKISPDGTKIIFAAAVGDPDHEAGSVFLLNLHTNDQTVLVPRTPGIVFHIERWIDNETVEINDGSVRQLHL